MLPILERVRFSPAHGASSGILAVSGGSDSVAMLRLWVERFPNLPVIVAHLNHQLRGPESAADAEFVQTLATSLNLRYCTTSVDVRGLAEVRGHNLEDTARQVRYEWLTKLAQDHHVAWIATGHTADDQAETVLQRLLRGTGLQGLRGIARTRELASGVELLRPLLQITRAELVGYLQSVGQDWREDVSNRDTMYTRNRIRHELLPMLETFNPAVRQLLSGLAEQASEAHDEQAYLGQILLSQSELPRAGSTIVLDAEQLLRAPRQRVRSMFRVVWRRENWPVDDMTFDHWNRLVTDIACEKSASDFPGGIVLKTYKGVVHLRRH